MLEPGLDKRLESSQGFNLEVLQGAIIISQCFPYLLNRSVCFVLLKGLTQEDSTCSRAEFVLPSH